jgi:hypothetical protein
LKTKLLLTLTSITAPRVWKLKFWKKYFRKKINSDHYLGSLIGIITLEKEI